MRNETAPVTGVELSRRLKVTRQTIVGDVALLRSAGRPIMATARGYILEGQAGQKECSRQFACQGRTQEEKELQLELNAVVDNGGVIHYLQLITGPKNRACP